ncbi:MAG: RpiB/LacA/LacB family sugar-phosphate isomerase [Verrucomicrobiia bacterium]
MSELSNKSCSHRAGFRAVARWLMGFQRFRVGAADDFARVNRFHIGTVGDQHIFAALHRRLVLQNAVFGDGASVCANKVARVRACLIHENSSAHQGVEDDDLNLICFGGLVVGHALAWELMQAFLAARFTGAERHRRRLAKVADLENKL